MQAVRSFVESDEPDVQAALYVGTGQGHLRIPVAAVVAFHDLRGSWVGTLPQPAQASPVLLWDTRDLAEALDVAYDTVKKWCAARCIST